MKPRKTQLERTSKLIKDVHDNFQVILFDFMNKYNKIWNEKEKKQ